MNFEGKVVLVTGAGKGIGKSIVENFAKNGARTVILDYDSSAGESLADELTQTYHPSLFVKTDVSQPEDLLSAREIVIKQFGKVDILVVNAGISYQRNLSAIENSEWQRVIDINLSGSFYTIKAFYEDFIQNKEGSPGKIIFITSGSGITGTGGGAHYAASKSGQHGLMRAVSKELGPYGVNVNAIAPRVIETAILDQLYSTEERRQDLLSKIPIGRFGQPQDIANLALFLASSESSYIHGQIILADGGRTY